PAHASGETSPSVERPEAAEAPENVSAEPPRALVLTNRAEADATSVVSAETQGSIRPREPVPAGNVSAEPPPSVERPKAAEAPEIVSAEPPRAHVVACWAEAEAPTVVSAETRRSIEPTEPVPAENVSAEPPPSVKCPVDPEEASDVSVETLFSVRRPTAAEVTENVSAEPP